MKIIWYSKTNNDLNQNIGRIAKNSPQNALMVLEEIINLVDSLSVFPYKYPKEPIYDTENIRFITKWSFKIVYRIELETIYILRIFNTHQDPKKVKQNP